MVGCYHQLNGLESEQTPGDEGQGSLAYCSLWDHKESNMTERLNTNNKSPTMQRDGHCGIWGEGGSVSLSSDNI